MSQGEKFRKALQSERPLQIVGVVNPYVALMAEKAGFKALYLSGAGVANYAHALPDLGVTTLNDVLAEVQKITDATDLPLLVDIDTGWGNALSIRRTISSMIKAGAAAVHIEDQESNKKCGHLEGKTLVPSKEMCGRIRFAVQAKTDPDFVIMARTDAAAIEGVDGAVERAKTYVDAGADMIFAEALTSLEDFRRFKEAVDAPLLANLTEFGKTPLFSLEEMDSVGVDMVLYPLSCARAMHFSAEKMLKEIRSRGSQKGLLEEMQERKTLYHYLDYQKKEEEVHYGSDKNTI